MCNQLFRTRKKYLYSEKHPPLVPSSPHSFLRVGYFPFPLSHAFLPCRAPTTLGRQGHHTRPLSVLISPLRTIPSCPLFKSKATALPPALKKLFPLMSIALKAIAVSIEVYPPCFWANCLSPSTSVVNYVSKSGGLPHGLDNGAKDAAVADSLK